MIPTPYTIYVKRYTSAGEDAHGNPISTFSAPEPVPVHWIAPGASFESVRAGRNVDGIAYNIGAPAGTVIDARDVVEVDGVAYEVAGNSLDWTRGPWPNPVAGVVIELRKRSG